MGIIKKENLSQKKLEQYYEYCRIIQWGRRFPCKFAEEFLGVEFMDFQRYVFMNSWDKQFVLWLMSRNAGKAISVKTPIKTSSGYKTMGDIKIGDYVFDENGNTVKVINTSEIFLNHDCYNVIFENGEVITCDSDHLWEFKTDLNNFEHEILNVYEMYKLNKNIDFYIPIGKKPNECNIKYNNFDYVKIKDIVKVKTVPTKCIMVDSDRKLYQCGLNNIVTHNSTLSAPFAMTKMMLFPNYRVSILSVTAQQSQDTFMKMENIAKKKIESFVGLTDIFLNEVEPTSNGDGFTHSPQGFKYNLYNGSGVISLAGDEDNIRGKFICLLY